MVRNLKKVKSKTPTVKEETEKTLVERRQFIHEHYEGVIPHPKIVEGYEKICPGATDRILAMAEDDLKHKHELEIMEQKNVMECRLKVLENDANIFKKGQILGFIVMLTALIGGFFLVYTNHESGGYSTVVGVILSYFVSVIYKNKVNRKLEEKEEEEN